MPHGKFPRVQKLTLQAWLYSAIITAMLACGQCRFCGVDGLGPAGSLNVTFAQDSRKSRVCKDAKGGLKMTGSAIGISGPVPNFHPVDATGTPLPGECCEFSKYNELRNNGRVYMRT